MLYIAIFFFAYPKLFSIFFKNKFALYKIKCYIARVIKKQTTEKEFKMRPMTEKEIAMLWANNSSVLFIRCSVSNKLFKIEKVDSGQFNPFIDSYENEYNGDELYSQYQYQSKDGTWRKFEVEELSKEAQILSDFADFLGKHDIKMEIKADYEDVNLSFIYDFIEYLGLCSISTSSEFFIDSNFIRKLIKK